MAKLIKCKCCGKEIANNCKVCIHCGAKISPKTGGCLTSIFIIAVLCAISVALPKLPEDKIKKSEKNAEEKKYFYDGSAIAASQRFIEKQINTKTELKFIGQAKCVRYKPDEFHKKIFTDMKLVLTYLYLVEGNFTEKNIFGTPIKYSYKSVVYWDFNKDRYIVIQLFIDDIEVFPKYREMMNN